MLSSHTSRQLLQNDLIYKGVILTDIIHLMDASGLRHEDKRSPPLYFLSLPVAFIAGARRVVQEVDGTISTAKAAGRGEAGRLRLGF